MTFKIDFFYFLIFFFLRENKTWYFMRIVCLAHSSYEISSFIVSKKWKMIYHGLVYYSFDLYFKG